MKSEAVSAIHDFTLKARELMLKEVDEQLEGVYGLLPNGEFEPANKYPALNELEEAQVTRRRLEQFIGDEEAAGISPKDARSKLALEIAFTRLNRLVALKMMATRGLIRQSVGKSVDSNGFKRWVAKNDQELEKYEVGDLPQNAIGEGPRQEAYRHYLLWLCAELSKEIKILFDPDNLPSRIFPRPRALNQLIEMMNADDLNEAWEPGGEETIGWVYQFFNENEKKDVFDRLYKKKQKIKKEDIPAATELFTPNWIVKWLVQNSLGRHWVQMHPDSRLADTLDYLVPLAGEIPAVPLKKASDIKMLDPACGTMHFGLVAFDIFYEMYQEELENAGNSGWPETPSVNDVNEIPAAIIANNIYGIDIDLRAVQLSALALFIKTKSTNKDAVIIKSNLGCADVIRFDREKLEKFIKELDLKDSVYARILRGVWEELENLSLAGSLLRFEVKLASLIEEEKRKFKEEKQPQLPGFLEEQFETQAGNEEFWEIIAIQIRQALDHYVKSEAEKGSADFLFTGETKKGFQVLDILTQRYDLVATNPPYMSAGNMNQQLAKFIKNNYPDSKIDLYATFIERCFEMLHQYGRLAMITQQSFMFISTFEEFRELLLEQSAIEAMCHIGPRGFEAISGEKVNTTAFTLRKDSNNSSLKNSSGVFFRLVNEPTANDKRLKFENILNAHKLGNKSSKLFMYQQKNFCKIPRSPWCYWANSFEYKMFSENPNLSSLFEIDMGLKTSANVRFVRWHWEVTRSKIAIATSRTDAMESGGKWFPFAKGGNDMPYSKEVSHVVNWEKDGIEVKEFLIKQYPYLKGNPKWCTHNEDLYFNPGIIWSPVSTGGLKCRSIPSGVIASNASYCIFVSKQYVDSLLVFMNSSIGKYIGRILCPTINHNKGDIELLPVPDWVFRDEKLREIGNKITRLVSKFYEIIEVSNTFICPPKEKFISDELGQLLSDADNYLFKKINIGERKGFVLDFLAVPLEENNSDNNSFVDEKSGEFPENEIDSSEFSKMWISYSVGIVTGRFQAGSERNLGCGKFSNDINTKLLSLAEADGILVMDSGSTDDLPERAYEALTLMLGESDAKDVIKNATGKDGQTIDLLRGYLDRTYFKEHIKQYRKRPVYWLLQSPKKKYGIWVFHEKMNSDTLYRIRSEYVESKINHLEGQISGLRKDRDRAEGRERRNIEKQIGGLTDVLDDVHEFEKLLKFISEERGYTPHIDDGVLLNMAPLWELIPSWQKEPKKAWEALERGEYDWSYQAMDHWPERVKEKCKTNKSFAIAHGLDY